MEMKFFLRKRYKKHCNKECNLDTQNMNIE